MSMLLLMGIIGHRVGLLVYCPRWGMQLLSLNKANPRVAGRTVL
jgi:hypothetical protein